MANSSTVLEHISALLAKGAFAEAPSRQAADDGVEVILSITGASAYDSLNALLAMIGRHWTHAGARLVDVNLSAPGWPDRLSHILGSMRVLLCKGAVGFGADGFGFEALATISLRD